jgi:Flp pilus assembly protein TadD
MAQNAGLATVAGFHQALIADRGGDTEGAEAAFRRTLAASADRPSLQLVDVFARFLIRNGKPEEASKLVADFVASNPQTLLIEPTLAVVEGRAEPDRLLADVRGGVSEVFRNVASLLNRKQLRTEALLFIRMALDLAPDDASAKFSLAQLLEARERGDLAIEAYEKIDPQSPYSWYARLGVADVLHARGESDEAIRLLRAMSSERPERADAPRALADLLRITERFDDAVTAYDLAVKRMGGDPDWGLLYTRGIALERAKRWDRAEQDFLKALDVSPEQPLVLNYLGYSWVEQGVQLERARRMIETAVEKRPRDGYITDSLGWVLYRLGDFENAVVHLERAVALEPGDPVINDHLGDAYWVVGRKLEARFQWLRSLSLEPDRDVEAVLRQKLEGKKFPKPLPPGKQRDL